MSEMTADKTKWTHQQLLDTLRWYERERPQYVMEQEAIKVELKRRGFVRSESGNWNRL